MPFVGRPASCSTKLLAEIGIPRERRLHQRTCSMCRPPGNRDPQPDEIQSCEPHLWKKIELIQPKLICTLGNFATKLLSGKPAGITRVHGRPQDVTLGGNAVTLYPIFHPAAALYTPAMLTVLQAGLRPDPGAARPRGRRARAPRARAGAGSRGCAEPAVQLGLF